MLHQAAHYRAKVFASFFKKKRFLNRNPRYGDAA
jgi:hypothetical protein